ncbi:SPOR domain-containing protein [Pseudoroseicyclus sp. CXY001]|uniref:SPOR domain-containing protein n=1 Tax=Pseudoroseicyclus sp. CXY001 TaxID=3242492 RepID=UPI003570B808
MKPVRYAACLALALGAAPAALLAQVPAEFPPANYAGNQFVDSEGCAFIRAGLDGGLEWVPRMSPQREQLCGYVPTFDTPPAQTIATNQPQGFFGLPDIDGSSGPIRPGTAAPTGPVATAAAPAAPARVAPAAPAAPAPRRITLAEACAGRTGVQPGLIRASTGQPVDCGSAAPTVVASAAAAPAMLIPAMAPVAASGPIGAPIPTGPTVRRLTLASACAEVAAGRSLIDQSTGRPLSCPAAPMPIPVTTAPSGPVLPGAPSMAGRPVTATAPMVVVSTPSSAAQPLPAGLAASCPSGVFSYTEFLSGGGGLPIRCGPQAQAPHSAGNAAAVTASAPGTLSTFGAPAPAAAGAAVPISNPVVGVVPNAPPPGYERAWDDGRVNLHRGTAGAAGVLSTSSAPVVSAPSAAPSAAPAGRYVQVGTYAEPGNAQRAVTRLQAMGLPVGIMQAGGMQAVAAGPFSSAQALQNALNAARGAGYADAYVR